ncbi:MAG: HAMP domain-containing histidine kinase [Lachnospiraceae bacterium]|nr:HAMP domain-containing histidine kinase [Lachnospiraceae bacterium]
MGKIRSFIKHPQIALLFAAIVFCINFISMFLVLCVISLLSRTGWMAEEGLAYAHLPAFASACLILGVILAVIMSNIPAGPINKLIDATDKIADGDYSVRVNFKGPKDMRLLGQKFNYMAQELGSVEMLRNDFVNNFSHELKTPIASIQGFAQVLLDRDVSRQEQVEYLNIIVKESKRLTDMSTNVLNLSRIEQQTILTDKKRIDISEQIRTTIIALDRKWSSKDVKFQLESEDSGEIYGMGNEELLKQVWLNLLDNAVKFSPDGGCVRIRGKQEPEGLEITISNRGESLPPEMARHIFDRFYQGDTSHTTEGNGLGLTIAQKIVKLHNGKLFLDCQEEGWVTFHVSLPAG